jgi:signal transduction histidine kinase
VQAIRAATAGTRSSAPPDAGAERLVTAAQRRLAVTTLVLLVALLVVVGAATAAVAQRLLDASVDRTLEAAATAELARIAERDGGEPAASGASGSSSGESSEGENGAAAGDEGEGAGSAGGASAPAATASPITEATDLDDHPPAAADTYFLYLNQDAAVVSNPERVVLIGLPDRAAFAAAMATGRDLRTVRIGETSVRLLTLRVAEANTSDVHALQAGFVLSLHDEQSATLLTTILVVGFGGLLGAAVVTVVVTRRALVPVRAAFERERRFVAAASHELRTPVAIIRSTAEVLGREGDVRPRGRGLVNDIVTEADRLGRLVEDLSDLAVAQARRPAVLGSVELTEVVAGVARRAGPLAASTGRKLVVEPSGSVTVRADRDRVVQVVLILVDNAIRHSPAGGTVTLRVARDPGRGRLSVADEGPGVPAAERDRIFEPFAQLAPPEATSDDEAPVSGASGLGLAIARAIVTAMNGEIGVDDAPRGGARFTVTLPLA